MDYEKAYKEAESENERIRGAIIEHLKDNNLTEWAAWLEKQGEQNPTNKNLTDVSHEYYSKLLSNDDSDNIDEYAYQCAYCMSHDWMKETATWEDVQKAVKLGAKWQKQKPSWSEELAEQLKEK